MKPILVVIDDCPDIQRLIKETLKDTFEVYPFTTAEETLIKLNTLNPAIIISDIMLPGMNGYELCSHLQENEKFRKIPFVILSTKSGSSARSMGYKLGAVNYIQKPFEPSEIKAIVKSLVRHDEFNLSTPDEDAIIEKKGFVLNRLEVKTEFNGKEIKATRSEQIILTSLVKNFGALCTRESLLEQLESTSNSRILDTHIRTLRNYIDSYPLKITTIYGKGYKIEDV